MKSEEFDKQVRSALEHREINPSENAWEKLQSRLDKQEAKRSVSPKVWWFAAAVAGMVLMVSGFLYTPAPQIDTLPVAEQEAVPESPSEKPSEVVVEHPSKDAEQVAEIENEVTDLTKAVVATPRHNKISDVMPASDPVETKISEPVVEAIRDVQVEAVVAIADEVTPDDAYNKEVDALLEAAMREVVHTGPDAQNKVDAAALLADVEEELDRNFKDKALEAIKKKIIKLRSAVADRNE